MLCGVGVRFNVLGDRVLRSQSNGEMAHNGASEQPIYPITLSKPATR